MKLWKTVLSCLLALTLVFSLCACGASEDAGKKERPAGMEATLPGAGGAEQTALEKARGLIGQSVEELYAQVGEPLSAEYAPSCLGDGDDGELVYDGFIVYTYREEGSELVEDVEAVDPAN